VDREGSRGRPQGVTAVYENHGMEAIFIEGYRALRGDEALTGAGRRRGSRSATRPPWAGSNAIR
jgi:hypothetical protein